MSGGGGGGGGDPDPDPPASQPQAPKPKVGDKIAGVPWTGGQPKKEWNGSENNSPLSPFCYRPLVEKDTKAYQKRTGGLKDLFGRDCKKYSVQAFADNVERHLQEHGMDSVFYIENDEGEFVSLLQHHSNYTVDEVEKKLKKYDEELHYYDSYDKDNLEWSARFLLNSVDDEVRKALIPKCRKGIHGPKLWMLIVSDVQQDSTLRMEQLRVQVGSMAIRTYKGENVKAYAEDVLEVCRELENGGCLPPNICSTINNQLTKCTVTDFKMQFMVLRKTLNDAERQYSGKSQAAIRKLATEANPPHYTYESLLEAAIYAYQNLLDSKLWGPAVVNKDRGKVPEAYFTEAEASALIQKLLKKNKDANGSNNGSNGGNDRELTCFRCGKKGHRSSECRSKAPKKENNKKGNNGKKRSWKKKPPNSGDPHTKTVDSMEWHWCAKCGYWRTSHGTADHKDELKGKTKKEKKAAAANVARTEDSSSEEEAVGLHAVWGNLCEVDVGYSSVWWYAMFVGLWSWFVLGFNRLFSEYYRKLCYVFGCCVYYDIRNLFMLFWNFAVNIVSKLKPKPTIRRKAHRYRPHVCHRPPPPPLRVFPSSFCMFSHVQLNMHTAATIMQGSLSRYKKDPTIRWNQVLSRQEVKVKHKKKTTSMETNDANASNKQRTNKKRRRYLGTDPTKDKGYRPTRVNNSKYSISCRELAIKYHRLSFPSSTAPWQSLTLRFVEMQLSWWNFYASVIATKLLVRFLPVFPRSVPPATVPRADTTVTPSRYKLRYPSCYHISTTEPDFTAVNPMGNVPDTVPPVPVTPTASPGTDTSVDATSSSHPPTRTGRSTNSPGAEVLNFLLAFPSYLSTSHKTVDLIWDTGASCSISPHKSDFKDPPTKGTSITVLKGIAKGLPIEGEGTVLWCVRSTTGVLIPLHVPAYYVPGATRRLFSPQGFFQTIVGTPASATQGHNGITLTLGSKTKIAIPYDYRTNLPMLKASICTNTSTGPNGTGGGGAGANFVHAISAVFPVDCSPARQVTPDVCTSCSNDDNADACLCVLDEQNQNLLPSQKELLRWHYRFGHYNFRAIQALLKSGSLGSTPMIKAASRCDHPKCASCMYSKAKRRPTEVNAVHDKPNPTISKDTLVPGQKVSMDHYKVTDKGRLFTSKGRTIDEEKYSGGVIFYDHASSYVHVEHQVHSTAGETVQAKIRFEHEMFALGVVVTNYHTDNGTFTAREFSREIDRNAQHMTFSGVGAQHQNGAAERSIGVVFSIARTMLLHAAIRWPEVINTELWPMAVDYAVWLYNRMPKVNNVSPLDLLTRSQVPRNVLHNAHVFGCPTYVLHPKQQAGFKLPKFEARSRRGVFLGFSRRHASTVPLVLNLETAAIGPQFHAVFDDWFSSVLSTGLDDPLDTRWTDLFITSRYAYEPDDDEAMEQVNDETLYRLAIDSTERATKIHQQQRELEAQADSDWQYVPLPKNEDTSDTTFEVPTQQNETLVGPVPPHTSQKSPIDPPETKSPATFSPVSGTHRNDQMGPIEREIMSRLGGGVATRTPNKTPVRNDRPTTYQFQSPRNKPMSMQKPSPKKLFKPAPVPAPVEPRRSQRDRKPPERYGYATTAPHRNRYEIGKQHQVRLNKKKGLSKRQQEYAYLGLHNVDIHDDGVEYPPDPFVYMACTDFFEQASDQIGIEDNWSEANAATVSDPDTFKWHEAVCQPDWEQFYEAAREEIRSLEQMGTWIEVPRDQVPKGTNILPGTWVFRRKRYPDGKLRKHKARYCVRGDKQVAGVDYFDTYAPVTNWSTVRLMFILTIVVGLESVQVDYTNAFVQADLKEKVYIQIPQGFSTGTPDKQIVLLLKKSLYGLVQAPRVFYEHLGDNLRRLGFEAMIDIDPCLWIHREKKMVCIVWVDDCLFFHKDKQEIFKVVNELKTTMPLTVEESITAFLGIDVNKQDDVYHLTQPRLIERVIEAVDMIDANSARTPATSTPIGADKDGLPFDEKWKYNSVIGMLMYLANNTRPDIAFATHQCARFTHAPRASHALAVKRIVRYLIGTQDRGLILRPKQNDVTLDCYVDADFAGLYGYEDPQDAVCARSRTGYVLTLSNCPLMWVSKLQTEVALSTMEAEYIALSQAMRDLIPMRRLVKAVCDVLLRGHRYQSRMHSIVFEDNNGALQLARSPRITPRTKHYGVKYHFFREQVKTQEIRLHKIDTKEQLADIFTKGLAQALFEEIRRLLMGW